MSYNNTCYDSCPLFSYEVIDKNRSDLGIGSECKNCSSNCFSCINESLCLSCDPKYYLANNSFCEFANCLDDSI